MDAVLTQGQFLWKEGKRAYRNGRSAGDCCADKEGGRTAARERNLEFSWMDSLQFKETNKQTNKQINRRRGRTVEGRMLLCTVGLVWNLELGTWTLAGHLWALLARTIGTVVWVVLE